MHEGVHKIINEIEKSAEQTAASLMAQAKGKADAMLSDATRRAEEERHAIQSRAELEAQRESQRILAEARIRVRREQMRAQEEMLQDSFQQAWETLRIMAEIGSIDGVVYKDILDRLIVESIVSSGAVSLEVLVNQRDRAFVGCEMLSRLATKVSDELGRVISLSLSSETLMCLGGVVVRSTDGKVCVDNTLEARMERFKDVLRVRVAKELFSRK